MNYLPKLDIINQISRGRNVYEGYQRGWGMLYGDVAKYAQEEPDFKHAWEFVRDRIGLVHPARVMNLYLMLKFYLPDTGDIIEFGTYHGGCAMFMAMIRPDRTVYALDTFSGMPPTDKSIDLHNEHDFSEPNVSEVENKARRGGITNLRLIKGRFEDTAVDLLRDKQIALAHIDCDIKSSVMYAFDTVFPRMVKGGYVAFDDATEPSCFGAAEAIEEIIQRGLFSEQNWPHYVFRSGL